MDILKIIDNRMVKFCVLVFAILFFSLMSIEPIKILVDTMSQSQWGLMFLEVPVFMGYLFFIGLSIYILIRDYAKR